CVVLIVPLLVLAVLRFQAVGGGMVWLGMNLAVYPVLLLHVHGKFLPAMGPGWLVKELLLAVPLNLMILLPARALIPHDLQRMASAASIFALMLVLLGAGLLTFHRVRRALRGLLPC